MGDTRKVEQLRVNCVGHRILKFMWSDDLYDTVKTQCRKCTYSAYNAHKRDLNSSSVSPWSLIGLSSLSPSGPTVTPKLLEVLERRSESRENMFSNVDFSFVKAERCTCIWLDMIEWISTSREGSDLEQRVFDKQYRISIGIVKSGVPSRYRDW